MMPTSLGCCALSTENVSILQGQIKWDQAKVMELLRFPLETSGRSLDIPGKQCQTQLCRRYNRVALL